MDPIFYDLYIYIYTPFIYVLGYGYPVTDPNAARKNMVTFTIFYHQEIAQIFMLAFFYQHHGSVMAMAWWMGERTDVNRCE